MKYAELMNKSDECMKTALEFFQKKEIYMMRFWRKASDEYKRRALGLTVEEGI